VSCVLQTDGVPEAVEAEASEGFVFSWMTLPRLSTRG
jgi:hypothetical protein